MGAIYLDGGLEAARDFVERHWRLKMDAEAKPPQDAKTALAGMGPGRRPARCRSITVVKSEGPPHDPIFEVEVRVAGQRRASAAGVLRRAAEQAAAATSDGSGGA